MKEAANRSGYLLSLDEVVGRAPTDRTWRDEWMELNLELARTSGFDIEATRPKLEPGGKFHYDTKLANYEHQVSYKTATGWSVEDAEAHVALSGACSPVLAESIKTGETRFAASCHAIYSALVQAAKLQTTTPPTCYSWIHGKGGLNEIDHKFASLEVPDANGFRGLTCAGEISCIGPTQTFDISEMFPRDGAKPQRREMSGGQATFKDLDGDVVAFISRPEDNAGLHSVINTGGAGSYRVPPQCLVVFKRYHSAGTWEVETASGAVRPDCGCFEVHITYVIPKDGHLHDETVTGDKFVPSVTSLTFGDRKLYARGRKEIENQPLPLSLREEWQRDDTWTDRGGMSFSAAAELAYVLGVAGVQPSGGGFRHTVCLRTFAGVRDAEHVGDTLADFLSKANEHVTRAAETMGMPLDARLHLLNEDEVLAIRLYTGPGYEVINSFLREMSTLSEGTRMKYACSRDLTYATTARALCSAVRKLSRVNPTVCQDGSHNTRTRRWRGVCGVLSDAFFIKDPLGMICATDAGFLSTSTAYDTPLHYMQTARSNVLWELVTSSEDEHGYHCGADVSFLSQFAGQREELYPPLTMLRVVAHSEISADDLSISEVQGRATAPQAPPLKLSASQVWRKQLPETKSANAMTAMARTQTANREWLERTSDTMRTFVTEHHAKMCFVDGKSFVHVLVQPTFV